MGEMESDLRYLSPTALFNKYGDAAQQMILDRSDSNTAVFNDLTTNNRTPLGTLYDTGAGIANGLGASVGGLTALGLGIVSDDAGTWTADKVNKASQWLQSTQSDQLNRHRQVQDGRNVLDKRDNDAQFERDVKNDGDLLAGLKSIGRETLSSIENASTTGSLLADGVSNAIGSLLAAGPLGKGIKGAGSLLIPESTKRGVGLAAAIDASAGNMSAARVLAGAAEQAPMLGAIGSLEAGSAYQQIAADIMGRSHETLMAESPTYRELIAQGVSREDAKIEVANRTGLLSAAITAPLAAATGAITGVAGFEAAPLAARGARQALGNIATQPLEEGTQGGISQLAQNYSEQQLANEDKRLSEGVGRQVGEGALFGLGMAATIEAPNAVAQSAAAAGRQAISGVRSAVDVASGAIGKLAEKGAAVSAAAAALADGSVSDAAAAAVEAVPTVEPALREAVETLDATPEEKTAVNGYIDRLLNATQVTPEEIEQAPERLKPYLSGSSSRIEVMQKLADTIVAADENSREALTAGLDLVDLLGSYDAIVNSSPDLIDQIGEDSPAKDILKTYEDLLVNVMNTPKIASAIAAVQAKVAQMAAQSESLPEITEASLNTVEGQQAIEDVMTVAALAPEQGNLKASQQILFHASKGLIQVTPEQKAALETSIALMQGQQMANAQAARLGKSDPVSLNITTEKGEKGESLTQHAKGVMSAWKAGDRDLAAKRLADLQAFAQHMQNKVGALNAHFTAGNPKAPAVHYQAFRGDWYTSREGVYVNTLSEGSVKLAQKIAAEARLVGEVFNHLATAFPDLVVDHVSLTPLNSALDQPAAQVVQQSRQGTLSPSTDTANSASEQAVDSVIESSTSESVTPEETEVLPQSDEQQVLSNLSELDDETLNALYEQAYDAWDADKKNRKKQQKVNRLGAELDRREDDAAALIQQEELEEEQAQANQEAPQKVEQAYEEAGLKVEKHPFETVFTNSDGSELSKHGDYTLIAAIATTSGAKLEVKGPHGAGIIELDSKGNLYLSKVDRKPTDPGIKKISFKELSAYLNPTIVNGVAGIQKSILNDPRYNIENLEADLGNTLLSLLNPEKPARNATPAPVTEPKVEQATGPVGPAPSTLSTEEIVEALDRAGPEDQLSDRDRAYFDDLNAELDTRIQEPEQTIEEDAPVSEAVEETLDPAGAAAGAKGIDALFPALIGAAEGVVNYFTKAFKLSEKPLTRTLGSEAPLSMIRDALSNSSALHNFLGSTPSGRLDADIAAAYESYLDNGQQMVEALDARLQKFLKKNGQGFLEGRVEANRWVNGKVLNITEKVGDNWTYNQELVEMATLAGLQWLMTADQKGSILDEKDVAALTGVPLERVSSMLVEQMNQGLSPLEAKRELASKITKYWGLENDQNGYIGQQEGIAEGMAAEILEVFKANGAITIEKIQLTEQDGLPEPKTIDRVIPLSLEAENPLLQYPSLIEEAVLLEPEDRNYIGVDVFPPVAQRQMRNPLVENTEQQKQMIENEQATPHYMNGPMIAFLQQLGRANALRMFAEGDLSKRKLNKNHAVSLDGRNRNIAAAYDMLMGLVSEVSNKASVANLALDQMPIRYGYNVSRVGRAQMLGRYSPQANKMVREAILPTRSTLDLNSLEGYESFMIGVAQALGIKVHKKMPQVAIKETEDLLNGKLANAVNAMETWVQHVKPSADNMVPDSDIVSDGMVDHLIESFKQGGVKLSPVAFHAVMEVARMRKADQSARSQFTTQLYLEADGMTNGPINAMVLLTTGAFTPRWIKHIAKGGLYINRPGMTANEYNSTIDKEDLYQATTNIFDHEIKTLREFYKDDRKVSAQLDHLLNLMSLLMPGDIKFDGINLVLDRGVAKNPLTITVYGSGARGIAGNFAQALTEVLYEKMSDVAEAQAANPDASFADALFNGDNEKMSRFSKAMHELTFNQTRATREGKLYVKSVPPVSRGNRKSAAEFTLGADEIANLQSNLLELFVHPLRNSISEAVDRTLLGSSELVQQATQIQSMVLEHFFKQQVQLEMERKAATDDSWQKSDFLTRKELQGIYKKLDRFAPKIETGTQTFFVAGSQSTDVDNSQYGRSLTDGFRSDGFVYGPKNSGVGGIAYINIGTGDGQMIQNMSVDPDRPTGTLPVFDGVHLPLNQIEKGGLSANKAVWDSWMGNPLKALHSSYSKFLPEVTLEDGSDLTKALARIFLPKEEAENASAQEVQAMLAGVEYQLEKGWQSVEARHRVLAQAPLSVDQMAATASPYQNAGQLTLESTDPESLAEQLNLKYHEELAKISKTGTVRDTVQAEINELGTQYKSGVRILRGAGLSKLLAASNMPAEQQSLLQEIVDQAAAQDYSVVYGTPDEIVQYNRNKGKKSPFKDHEGEIHGWTDFSDKTIYLVSPSSETLVHELVHAATFEMIHAFYAEPGFAQSNVRAANAIRRIEQLMKEFMAGSADLSLASDNLRSAYSNAQDAIRGHLNNPRIKGPQAKAAALNEFMAWNLTNQSLISLGKRTKASKLAQMTKKVIAALKDMFWRGKEAPKVADDVFSNLRFNTSILLNLNPSLLARRQDVTLFQSTAYGQNDRLTEVARTFDRQVTRYLRDPIQLGVTDPDTAVRESIPLAHDLANMFAARGFSMNMQQLATFKTIVGALATEAKIDANAMAQAQRLYAHVAKQLTVEHFMADPESLDPASRYYAQQKFDAVMGKYLKDFDIKGRSTLMPGFLALATVSDEFRGVLSNIELPKTERNQDRTLDAVLENLGTRAMESLSARLSGANARSTTVQEAIDDLHEHLQAVTQEQESFIDNVAATSGGFIDKANDIVIEKMNALSDTVMEKADKVRTESNNRLVKLAAGFAQGMAGVVSEKNGQRVAEGVMSLMNQGNVWEPFHTLINDMIGRTTSNANIYDMIKSVRSTIQQVRQQFRKDLPKTIASKFSRTLEESEWSTLFRGLAKTDLASLQGVFSQDEIMDLLKDGKKLDKAVQRLENSIEKSDPNHFKLYQAKMVQLAHFMATGVPGNNLLRNAHAIGQLFGEQKRRGWAAPADHVVSQMDQLVSLYALQDLSKADRDSLASLVQTEGEGMRFVFSYLVGQYKEEQRKVASGAMSRINAYKGHVQTEGAAGVALRIANDGDEGAKLLSQSFVRVGDYEGSSLGFRGDYGYYFAPVSARASFEQGIMQNVKQTASGVDPATGHTVGMIAGRITDPARVKRIRDNLKHEFGAQPLLPVYNENGVAVAFELSVDPVMMERLEPNTNLAQVIGKWRGRQVEEASAQESNKAMVDALYAMQQKEGSRRNEYVNLFGSGLDPVIADAVALMTPETRAYIESVFGDEFLVRKDMLNDVLGYRSASVGDMWSGISRWSPEAQKQVRNLLMGIWGNKAYQYMVNAEKTVQNLVSDAKTLIVVKSVVVPMANMLANIYQMVSRGVPLLTITRQMPRKLAEIDSYTASRTRQIEAEAELRAAGGNPNLQRRLEAEIQSITDGHKRLSIWPLIEAGEFSSITDADHKRGDVTLTQGKLMEYIESAVDKLPKPLGTVGRYALVTKDTALFRGLEKSVQYGDFLGKAVIYEDLTKRLGLTRKEALARITEEFVNFDRLPGRTRGALEGNGIMWFYNFKIRIAKIALSTIRNNPVHALLAGMAPEPLMLGDVGSPIEDNMLTKLMDGSLSNSIGPGQGLDAFGLNPWVNLTQ